MTGDLKRAEYSALLREKANKSALRPAAHRQAHEWIDRHGLQVGDLMCQARDWLEIDVEKLREPPTGWTFTALLVPSLADPPGAMRPQYTEDQQREMRAFWQWYGPLESHLIGLCALIAAMRTVCNAGPEVAQQFEALIGVAMDVHARYADRVRSGEIAWLPARLEWRKSRGQHEKCTVVRFLGRHLIEYSGQPPRELEEVPPPTDDDRMYERPF